MSTTQKSTITISKTMMNSGTINPQAIFDSIQMIVSVISNVLEYQNILTDVMNCCEEEWTNRKLQNTLYLACAMGKIDHVKHLVEHHIDIYSKHVKYNNLDSDDQINFKLFSESQDDDIEDIDEYGNRIVATAPSKIFYKYNPGGPVTAASLNKFHKSITFDIFGHDEIKLESVTIGYCAMHSASKNGHVNIIEYLLDNGIDIVHEKQIIESIFQHNYMPTIKFMLDNGADVQLYSSIGLSYAYKNNNRELIKYMIDMGADPETELINACSYSCVDIIKYCIERGADVNYKNGAPLIIACTNSNYEIVKYLIENNADIQISDNEAILTACKFKDLRIVKLLVENGADINVQNNIVLKIACQCANQEIVKCLVENGADVFSNTYELFVIACKNDQIEIVRYLFENFNVKLQNKKKLFKTLENLGYDDIIDYLKEQERSKN